MAANARCHPNTITLFSSTAMTPGPSHNYTNFTLVLKEPTGRTGICMDSYCTELAAVWHHCNNLVYVQVGRSALRHHTSSAAYSFPLKSWWTFHASSLSVDPDCLSICHFLPPCHVCVSSFFSVLFSTSLPSLLPPPVPASWNSLTVKRGAAQGQFPECCSTLALI